MKSVGVVIAIFLSVCISANGQDLVAENFYIMIPSTRDVTHTMCDADITDFSVSFDVFIFSDNDQVTMTSVGLFYSDYRTGNIGAANTVTTDSGHITFTHYPGVDDVVAIFPIFAGDSANCDAYTDICINIIVPNDNDTTNNMQCVAFKPSYAASLFRVTSPEPSRITYTTRSITTITFVLGITDSRQTLGSLTDTNLYFTDSGQYENATLTSAAMRSSKPTSGQTIALTWAAETIIDDVVADLIPDATNCAFYTHVCAVIIIGGSDLGGTVDNDICIELGNNQGTDGIGEISDCSRPNIAAGYLTVTAPDPLTADYGCESSTITFSLNVLESAGVYGLLTDIHLYFTNDAEYEFATVTSSAVRASVPISGTPITITATSGVTVTDNTAEFTVVSDVCTDFTHLCAVITVADDMGVLADDDTCIELSSAGVIHYPSHPLLALLFCILATMSM